MSKLICDDLSLLMNDATIIRHKKKRKEKTEQTFKKRKADSVSIG